MMVKEDDIAEKQSAQEESDTQGLWLFLNML